MLEPVIIRDSIINMLMAGRDSVIPSDPLIQDVRFELTQSL